MTAIDGLGNIFIDREEAQADIRQIGIAANILEGTLQQLHSLKLLAEQSKGETAVAIREKTEELQRKVKGMTEDLEEAQRLIRAAVQSYEDKDLRLSRIMSELGQ